MALVTGRQKPQGIAVNSTTLYWAEKSSFSDSAVAMPIGGGTPVNVGSMASFSNIVADGSNAYAASGSSCTYPDGTISDDTGQLFSTSTYLEYDQPNPSALAVDSNYVYWVDAGTFACHWVANNQWYFDRWSLNGSGTVQRAPLGGGPGGGTIVTLVSGVDPQNSFWQPVWLAVNAHYLYWVDARGLNGIGLDGLAPSYATVSSASIVALDANDVYWSDAANGTVKQMPAQGGSVTTLASGQTPLGVISDGLDVYWVNTGTSANGYTDGAVKKVPVGGGTATTIATVTNASGYLALDSTSVYWTVAASNANNEADGAVWKASK